MKQLALLLVALGMMQSVTAQSTTTNKKAIEYYHTADNFRVKNEPEKALALLQKAIQKDKKFEEAYWMTGLIHWQAARYSLAKKFYRTGLSLASDKRKSEYYYSLSHTYLQTGDYDSALFFSSQFLKTETNKHKYFRFVDVWNKQAQYSLSHPAVSDYRITLLSDTLNRFPLQYFPVLFEGDKKLLFTVRHGNAFTDDEDLFFSEYKNNRWQMPRPFSAINSSKREGAAAISMDGRYLVFTGCDWGGCDLYESFLKDNNWSTPEKLPSPINTKNWEAQPSLSADGRELYFVSDRLGGSGGYDIWYSKKEKEQWQKPIPVSAINTPLDEISPHLHADGTRLFFASNGLPGYGGYDLYWLNRDTSESAKNMGAPLNTYHDEYAATLTLNGQTLYYSQDESKTKSSLWKADLPVAFIEKPALFVQGICHDKKTKQPLRARLVLQDIEKNKTVETIESDSLSGAFYLVLPYYGRFALHAEKASYLFSSDTYDWSSTSSIPSEKIFIALEKIDEHPSIILHNIFFETNSYQLKEESKNELTVVQQFLQNNPALRVCIVGHTDNVGTEAYNKQLSLQRAEAVKSYLVQQGISAAQLDTKGLGFEQPLAENATEEGRKKNRRIEFSILPQKK